MMTLADIAEHIGAELHGDPQCEISSLATLNNAGEQQITFLANSKYNQQLAATNASAVILSADDLADCPCNALVLAEPYAGYAKVAQLLDTTPLPATGIHPTAVIAEGVELGEGVAIGANTTIESGVTLADGVIIGSNCFIGKGAQLGAHTKLWANVVIYHQVIIGSQCLLHSGVVIGSDGFGFAKSQGQWHKIPQLGTVIVGDRVEIGANTTVDRGALENTEIHDGVIIDNQCQIAHNDIIGENTAIAGCTVVAGSTTIGKNCTIGGAVAINGHMTIADNAYITGMSMVTKEISQAGVYSSGIPALSNKEWRKNTARFKQLDLMYKRLAKLEKELALLQGPETQA
jgi:UDP-3-O-[3-hydroxymyristoyl] glucosamine N-acyltransferase